MKLKLLRLVSIITVLLLSKPAIGQEKYQGPIDDNTYLSTVRITKASQEKISVKQKKKTIVVDSLIVSAGTGFFVFRRMPDATSRIFLVTNKHMIGSWSLNDSLVTAKNVFVGFYTKNGLFKNITISLNDATGKIAPYVHPYPNQVVDVVVIDITSFLSDIALSDVALFGIPIENLVSLANLNLCNIYTGSQVLIAGYPSGIGIASQSRPIIKSAIISSPLTTIDIIITIENRNHQAVMNSLYGKIILIDGYIVGGNSGGPVFTPRDKIISDPKVNLGQVNYVIGIVSSVYNNTGVSVLYSSDYIKDLIYQYTKN
ncbi:MAG: hypothetical protein JWR09_5541 [Mucilaginibacter sp.]|nr:hypothetical protein [Mucilaginibacter sp.]